MTYFQAYLLTRLDAFQHLFGTLEQAAILLIVVNGVAQIISLAIAMMAQEEEKKVASYFKITIPLFIVILVIKSLIPTTKEAAFIYVAPAIVNNKNIQKTIKKLPELSGLGLEYLGEILKQEIKETKGEVINEVKKSIK
tara:strand:- start:591 stop:1007 length:417 start_codon:yes stop_codon:yes gene_type:complete